MSVSAAGSSHIFVPILVASHDATYLQSCCRRSQFCRTQPPSNVSFAMTSDQQQLNCSLLVPVLSSISSFLSFLNCLAYLTPNSCWKPSPISSIMEFSRGGLARGCRGEILFLKVVGRRIACLGSPLAGRWKLPLCISSSHLTTIFLLPTMGRYFVEETIFFQTPPRHQRALVISIQAFGFAPTMLLESQSDSLRPKMSVKKKHTQFKDRIKGRPAKMSSVIVVALGIRRQP